MSSGSLWSNRDFVKLWAAQSISLWGSLITRAALPFVAVLALDATPFQVALLGVTEIVPGLLFGLIAGVWVDRLPRRPILIAADLGRALVLLTIPLAALFDLLRIELLYAAGLLTGVLTIFFEIAYHAYLPSLVGREHLVEGNAKLAASASVAEIGGFGVAGWLVQLFSGPVAVLIDAVTFLWSAACLALIRRPEPPPVTPEQREPFMTEVTGGLRTLWSDPRLRAIAAGTLMLDFAFRIVGAVYVIFVARQLGFSPGVLGLIYAVGGFTSLAGAVLAQRATVRLGMGPALVVGMALAGLGNLFLPLAPGATLLGVGILIAQQLVTDPGYALFEITSTSLRQSLTPDHLLGRVNGSLRVLGQLAQLLGVLAGGLLAEQAGLRPALVVSGVLCILTALWLGTTAAGKLRRIPAPVVAGGAA